MFGGKEEMPFNQARMRKNRESVDPPMVVASNGLPPSNDDPVVTRELPPKVFSEPAPASNKLIRNQRVAKRLKESNLLPANAPVPAPKPKPSLDDKKRIEAQLKALRQVDLW